MPEAKIIDQIVHDLLESEPSLRDQEEKLRQAVAKLLASKPEVPRDETFYSDLRAELMKRFSEETSVNHVAPWYEVFTKPIIFVPAGALVAVGLIAYVVMPGTGAPKEDDALVPTGGSLAQVNIVRRDMQAFGSLAAVGANGESVAVATRPQSGGGGMGLGGGAGLAAAAVSSQESAKMADTGMIAPVPYDPTVFTYKYEGEPLNLEAGTLTVLRRLKGNGGTGGEAVASLLPNFIDSSRFSDLKVQSIGAIEDKPFGLALYADMIEETVSLSQNYSRWPHPEQQCRDQACYENLRVRESDLPSDADAVRMADAFMSAYGITRDGYGSPWVRSDWRRWYEAMADKSAYWFPETVSVVYPLTVEGTEVVDDSGYSYGPTVNVNVRERRADGLWNLFSRNYEAAEYAAETDPNAILSVAGRGGVYAWTPEPGTNYKTVEIRLGTPSRVLLRSWQYGGDGTGKELLVPALRFPVLDSKVATDAGMPPEFIVIPLVKELLVRPDNGPGGPITIMRGTEATVAPAEVK